MTNFEKAEFCLRLLQAQQLVAQPEQQYSIDDAVLRAQALRAAARGHDWTDDSTNRLNSLISDSALLCVDTSDVLAEWAGV